jgi:2-amino-4-hydroxy-6-hydroxymethyldihydropteridine diphosphokinase
MGDPKANLALAVRALVALSNVRSDLRIDTISPVYMTEPQEKTDQPWFANQVARLVCAPTVTPLELLDALELVERSLGRRREDERERYGPRVIDLDLLLFHHKTLQTPNLVLPHPAMRTRAFVLVPLSDIVPDLVFPDGESLKQAMGKLAYRVEGDRIHQHCIPQEPTPC